MKIIIDSELMSNLKHGYCCINAFGVRWTNAERFIDDHNTISCTKRLLLAYACVYVCLSTINTRTFTYAFIEDEGVECVEMWAHTHTPRKLQIYNVRCVLCVRHWTIDIPFAVIFPSHICDVLGTPSSSVLFRGFKHVAWQAFQCVVYCVRENIN